MMSLRAAPFISSQSWWTTLTGLYTVKGVVGSFALGSFIVSAVAGASGWAAAGTVVSAGVTAGVVWVAPSCSVLVIFGSFVVLVVFVAFFSVLFVMAFLGWLVSLFWT